MIVGLSPNYRKHNTAVQPSKPRITAWKKGALESASSFAASRIARFTPLSIVFPLVLTLKASSEKKKALGIDRGFDRSLKRVIGFLLIHLSCCYSDYGSCIDSDANRFLFSTLFKVNSLCYQFLGVKVAGSEISAPDFLVKMSSSLLVESFAGAVAQERELDSKSLIAVTFLASVLGYYVPVAVEALMRPSFCHI